MKTLRFEPEDYSPNLPLLIAIKTAIPDYFLAYQINKILSIYLVKQGSYFISQKGSEHNLYQWENLLYDEQWQLIQNRSNPQSPTGQEEVLNNVKSISFLVNSRERYDYFIKVKRFSGSIKTDEMVKKIQNITNIVIAKKYDHHGNIKTISNLIF